jgi:hypothetical protein
MLIACGDHNTKSAEADSMLVNNLDFLHQCFVTSFVSSFEILEASFMAGFSFFDKMDQDSDFDALRKDPRFVDLVAKYRSPPK